MPMPNGSGTLHNTFSKLVKYALKLLKTAQFRPAGPGSACDSVFAGTNLPGDTVNKSFNQLRGQ
jgi:hypothetical protein